MSAYPYECLVKEYIRRSNCNSKLLDIIKNFGQDPKTLHEAIAFNEDQYLKENQKELKVFEVTELINSLFSVLVVPNEYFQKDYGAFYSEVDDLSGVDGYEQLKNLIRKFKTHNLVRDTYNQNDEFYYVRNFLKHMRNSLSHSGAGGILFYPSEPDAEISHVYFFDYDNSDTKRRFCAKLSIDDIKELKEDLTIYFSELDKIHNESNDSLFDKCENYNENCRYRDNFLRGKDDDKIFDKLFLQKN